MVFRLCLGIKRLERAETRQVTSHAPPLQVITRTTLPAAVLAFPRHNMVPRVSVEEDQPISDNEEHEHMESTPLPTETDEQQKARELRWADLYLLEALLMTTPSLRAMTGNEVQKCVGNREMDSCSICLEDHCTNEKYRKLPCNHVFHVGCVDAWFKSSVACPLCKGSVVNKCSEFDRNAALETVRLNKLCIANRTRTHSTSNLDESYCSPNRRDRPPTLRVASRRHLAFV